MTFLPLRPFHRREAYDAGRNPIFLGEVQGLGIRPVRRLIGEPG